MTLLASIAAMIAVAASAFLFAGIGALVLRACKVQIDSNLERMLFALGAGVIVFVLLVTLGEVSGNTKAGVRIAVAAAAVLGLFGAGQVARVCWAAYRAFLELPRAERSVAYAIAVVLALEGFAAVAPLIGSDALHYHFAAQANWVQEGLHPNFYLSDSFFSGMNHQLILAGLALGSEKLALGWIFLGGAAAAFAVMQLTHQWVNGVWPWLAAFAFLLSRVVLWQAAGSGAPDIWMTLFVVLAVLAILRAKKSVSRGAVALAGVFVGMVAGGKYTGLSLAALLGVMRDNSPDYARQEFVNAQLAGEVEGNALVFFRHVYYLRVPYLDGNPGSSWAIDPERLQTDEAWLQLFHENRIRWIVKDEEYPSPIRAPLMRLEAEGVLFPCASQSIEIREGMSSAASQAKNLSRLSA